MSTQQESRSGSHEHDSSGESGCCGDHAHAADPKQRDGDWCGGHEHKHEHSNEHTEEAAGPDGCHGGSRAAPTG